MSATHSASGHDLTPLSDTEKQQRAESLTAEENNKGFSPVSIDVGSGSPKPIYYL